jgi:hypothetical protein
VVVPVKLAPNVREFTVAGALPSQLISSLVAFITTSSVDWGTEPEQLLQFAAVLALRSVPPIQVQVAASILEMLKANKNKKRASHILTSPFFGKTAISFP